MNEDEAKRWMGGCAVLMPITEDTDLEVIALSQNKRFWSLYDRALERAKRKGWTPLEDVET